MAASEFPSIHELSNASGDIVRIPSERPPLLAEAIGGPLADPERWHQLGEFGRRSVENGYGWSEMGQMVVRLTVTVTP